MCYARSLLLLAAFPICAGGLRAKKAKGEAMTSTSDLADLLSSIDRYKLPGYTDSKALLYWFLYNVFRLDEIQSRDSICDGPNDKGIDGVWVDEDSEEIFLFQSYFTSRESSHLGDSKLKEFVGSTNWFAKPHNLHGLLKSSANAELKARVAQFQLVNRLEAGFSVVLVFVTTRLLDYNGKEYLGTLEASGPRLECWDRPRLIGQHQSLSRKTRVTGKHTFALNQGGISYVAANKVRAYVVPIRAIDIASMGGISDRRLFALNVRVGLGRTRVNRELEAALKEKEQHPNFVLFHNGVTVICKRFAVKEKALEICDYAVANGCQSAIAFYDNRYILTESLLVLCRFIEVGDDDALAEDITYRSNNQNGISLRDLRSNDRIQISLQKECQKEYPRQFEYVIKAGEKAKAKDSVTNDRAGQLIMSLYLNEPYNAHQKYRIFGSDYERIFSRDVNAARIYLSSIIYHAIESVAGKIEDALIRDYQLTKFVLMGVVGEILRKDKTGAVMLNSPSSVVSKKKKAITQSVASVTAQVITDFNYYVKEKQTKEYYDYKSEFKSLEKYRAMSLELQRLFERSLLKHPEDSFESIFSKRIRRAKSARARGNARVARRRWPRT